MYKNVSYYRIMQCFTRSSPAFAWSIFQSNNDTDTTSLPVQDVYNTGIESVKKMYRKNDLGEISVELHTVIQSSLTGFFSGASLGGFLKSREAYIYFIENNQATAFTTPMEAKKKLQESVTLAFAKGAYRWGWRLGLFTGCFSIISTTLQVYRGTSTVLEYIVAGAVTGAIYKANLGLAASIVGAGLGAVLSAFGGLLILLLLELTGVSMDDIRKSLYTLKEARENTYREALDKSATIKNDELTKHHDDMVKSQGEQKIDQL